MNRFFLSLFSALLVASAVLAGGYWHDAYQARPAPDAQSLAFVVKSGETVKVVAAQLKASGIISDVMGFELFARLHDAAKRLQAGNFQLKPGMSFSDVLSALSNAASQDVQVTIPEGSTAAQIGGLVRTAVPSISPQDWTAAVGPHGSALADADLARALPPSVGDRGLEGFLFPDTYRFRPDASAQDVVHTLLFTFLQKTAAAGLVVGSNGTVGQGLTFDQAVTLASVVQMEAKDDNDMPDVADVFLKRLSAGMPLQSDATVAYAIGHANLSLDDLAFASPYNTYLHPGLPLGPIDNPGLSALQAVVHPHVNPYFFFLTTSDGTVKYARTLDEHNANKRKYLK